MEYYLKILENGKVICGKKKTHSTSIEYDEKLTFEDFDEGFAYLNQKYGVEKREIHYIHQLDI